MSVVLSLVVAIFLAFIPFILLLMVSRLKSTTSFLCFAISAVIGFMAANINMAFGDLASVVSAPIFEELLKLFGVILVWFLLKKRPNIVWVGITVGVAFAAYENTLYFQSFLSSFTPATFAELFLIRSIACVSFHAMSTALASHVFEKGFVVVVVPIFLHFLYNTTTAYMWVTFLILFVLGSYLFYVNMCLKDKPVVAEVIE